ncbi:hypothetical protein [Paludifilum halophilum]|uniref:DUF4386 domain-containing protein n=1 Tax=Paludifilum halophilum TaxID=1642702 RepID=A0A235B446_9BACL|nr:hypothetical protein [Paludifilum halophilum]OYD07001.1 hypothetical protein CHM34_13795 [Paludifilum halophilum]
MDSGHLRIRFWYPWLAKSAAAINLTAVVLSFLFLVRIGHGSLGERMSYIVSNETAVIWSWGSGILATTTMTGIFCVLLLVLDQRYRAILQMALMIWITGAATGILHDLIQMTVIPALSQLFLQVPTENLAQTIIQWEKLLVRWAGVFGFTCYAISGLIYTAVMFRTNHFPDRLARYSFGVWTFLLLSAVLVRWLTPFFPWMTTLSLLALVPWFWQLGRYRFSRRKYDKWGSWFRGGISNILYCDETG